MDTVIMIALLIMAIVAPLCAFNEYRIYTKGKRNSTVVKGEEVVRSRQYEAPTHSVHA